MSTIVTLSEILTRPGVTAGTRRAAGSACSAGPCGSGDKTPPLPDHIREKVEDHPCYSEDAHHFFARMHVAVAPACNIQCNYCHRKYDCANESRPGVVSERLTPEQAARKVAAVAAQLPQLSVVGIAGPGDALADARRTFETCARVAEVLPDVRLCLSTNGLALPDHVETIRAHGIDHVTITINAIDPEVAERIYAWVAWGGKRLTGRPAAELLLERQWAGLDALVAAGVLVKVNSVMIPGINDDHLPVVNAEVKRRGAFLHNIMPLISAPEHGTHFGLTGQRGPTPGELKGLQDRIGGDGRLMKHCRQCRADAVGLLGEDRGREFSLDALPENAEVDVEGRRAYRAVIQRERAHRSSAHAAAVSDLAGIDGAVRRLVAVCTKGSGRINQHFGHAREFQVFEVDGSGVRLVGTRRVDHYCTGGAGDDDILEHTIAALDGIDLVLCARIGACPSERLAAAGIRVSDRFAHEYIEPSVAAAFLEDVAASPALAASA